MPAYRTLAGFALLTVSLLIRTGLSPPRRMTTVERLSMLPRRDLPLDQPVTIHWDDHQVPFIEAGSDRDLAVALGLVHAHLRLGQMELMRHAAHGRLAELAGPAAIELDHTLRILDLPRAVPAILAGLPAATRDWLDGFAAGINAQIAGQPRRPYDLAALGCHPAPWGIADLIAIGRLAGTDFTWRVWGDLLRFRGHPDWVAIWQRLMRQRAPLPSFAGGGPPDAALSDWLAAFRRGGSNSLAVAGRRSVGGAAMIASDPHLSVMLPNLWLIAGLASPGLNAVGLMIPGVPVLALGRNRWIGWGGTNLHAASSELFDLTGQPADRLRMRRERIRVRWGRTRRIRIRESDYGPIMSDAPLLRTPPGRDLALRWIGHGATDEVSAMLAVARARDWDEFCRALDGFAIPAQNMIYADALGRVGQAMAARLPRRPPGAPEDILAQPAQHAHWDSFVTARDLPAVLDPPDGFVASANNRPGPTVAPVGFFFSAEDRITRLRALLGGGGRLAPADLRAIQRDVLVPSALPHRDLLLRFRGTADPAPLNEVEARLWRALQGWDGRYEAHSEGALAFELLVYHVMVALHGRTGLGLYRATWDPWALLRDDLDRLPAGSVSAALDRAVPAAAAAMAGFADWGDMHRLRLMHIFGILPVIGRRFRQPEERVAGSNETLMKTAHGLSGGRHRVRYGANARHVSDFADPNANDFVLLGGQDGWLGSANATDQLPLWRRGHYIRVPLDPAEARRRFPHHMALMPAARP